jgi:hypothetical protein
MNGLHQCWELFGLFWTLSIVWYIEDKNHNVTFRRLDLSPFLVQWLRLALSNGPNWVGLSCPIHLRTDTDPVSETLRCGFLSSIYQTMDRVQNKPHSSVQHIPCQNPFKFTPVYLNRLAAARYRALESIIPSPRFIKKRIYWAEVSQRITGLHGVTCQKAELFIITAERTSNPTQCCLNQEDEMGQKCSTQEGNKTIVIFYNSRLTESRNMWTREIARRTYADNTKMHVWKADSRMWNG